MFHKASYPIFSVFHYRPNFVTCIQFLCQKLACGNFINCKNHMKHVFSAAESLQMDSLAIGTIIPNLESLPAKKFDFFQVEGSNVIITLLSTNEIQLSLELGKESKSEALPLIC